MSESHSSSSSTTGSGAEELSEENDYRNWSEMPTLATYPISGYTLFKNRGVLPKYTWNIQDISRVLNKKTRRLTSKETFVWNSVEARVKLSVSKSDTVSISLHVLPRSSIVQPTDVPTVYYVLLDRMGGSTRRNVVRSCHPPFGSTFDYSMTFERQLCPKSWLASPVFNVNNSVEIQVYVMNPPKDFNYYDGVLKWCVEEFQKTKRASDVSEGDESWYFSTSKKKQEAGYVTQAQLTYYQGTRWHGKVVEKDRMRLRVAFRSGEFDARLLGTFPHRTNILLRNPELPACNMKKSLVGSSVTESDDWHVTLEDEGIINAECLEVCVDVKLFVSSVVAFLMDFQLGQVSQVKPRGGYRKKSRCPFTFRV